MGGTNIQNITSNFHLHDYLFFKGQIPQGVVRRMTAVGFDLYVIVVILVPKPLIAVV